MNWDDLYSFTKIDTYDQCPYKFKLIYIDKKRAPGSTLALDTGTLIHKTEQLIADKIIANELIDYVAIKNDFIGKWLDLESKYPKDVVANDKSNRTMVDKIYYYLNEGIYNLEKFTNEHPELEIVAAEKDFEFPYIKQYKLRGSIDRLFRNKNTGKYLIQDIKTYSEPKKKSDLVTPLQFVVYSLAAKELYGINPEDISCQYYLPFVADENGKPGMVQDAGTPGFIKRGIAKLNECFEGIENKNFKPKQSCLCNYCAYCVTNPDALEGYKTMCPYHGLWERTTRNSYDIYKAATKWEGLENDKTIVEAYMNRYSANVKGGESNGKSNSL